MSDDQQREAVARVLREHASCYLGAMTLRCGVSVRDVPLEADGVSFAQSHQAERVVAVLAALAPVQPEPTGYACEECDYGTAHVGLAEAHALDANHNLTRHVAVQPDPLRAGVEALVEHAADIIRASAPGKTAARLIETGDQRLITIADLRALLAETEADRG